MTVIWPPIQRKRESRATASTFRLYQWVNETFGPRVQRRELQAWFEVRSEQNDRCDF